jgi:hypothetical protein
MVAVMGRRRWWATRFVACYSALCATLAFVEVVAVHPPGWLFGALVVLSLPSSLVAWSVLEVGRMTMVFEPAHSLGWVVAGALVWTATLLWQVTLVARFVFDDARVTRASRAPRGWSLRRLRRRPSTTRPPGHGPTVRI